MVEPVVAWIFLVSPALQYVIGKGPKPVLIICMYTPIVTILLYSGTPLPFHANNRPSHCMSGRRACTRLLCFQWKWMCKGSFSCALILLLIRWRWSAWKNNLFKFPESSSLFSSLINKTMFHWFFILFVILSPVWRSALSRQPGMEKVFEALAFLPQSELTL